MNFNRKGLWMVLMQSQNFEHLRLHWLDLANLGGHAKQYAFDDPQSTLIKLRCFAEMLVGIVYCEITIMGTCGRYLIISLSQSILSICVVLDLIDQSVFLNFLMHTICIILCHVVILTRRLRRRSCLD